MGARCIVKNDYDDTIDITASIDQTILQAVAGSAGIEVWGWGIVFTSVDGSEPKLRVILERQSTAGTGGDAADVVNLNNEDGRTLITTAQQQIDGGTNPTAVEQVFETAVAPAGGGFHRRFDDRERITVGPTDRLGIRVIGSASNTSQLAYPYFFIEE